MDFIKELGELALGSRLGRLLERMNKDISRFYKILGTEMEARWFTILYLLGTRSPMRITDIADILGVTHQAINKQARQMSGASLVRIYQGEADKRERLIAVTKRGEETIAALTGVWEKVRGVVTTLTSNPSESLLDSIGKVEKKLDSKSMLKRLTESMMDELLDDIEIVPFRPGLAKHFKELNLQWMSKSVKIEERDEQMLSNPSKLIVRPGGALLFADLNARIVGTCALIPHDKIGLELAKLAVDEEFRGRFIGTKLVVAAIEEADRRGETKLFAETGPNNDAFICLLKSLEFQRSPDDLLPARYRRARITMELEIE